MSDEQTYTGNAIQTVENVEQAGPDQICRIPMCNAVKLDKYSVNKMADGVGAEDDITAVAPKLKNWNCSSPVDKLIDQPIEAKTSFDGNFISVKGKDGKLCAAHLKYDSQEIISPLDE